MENERFILQTFQWNQTARKWMNSSPSIDEIHIKCRTLSFKFVYFVHEKITPRAITFKL